MMQFSFIGTRFINNICVYTNTIETWTINIKIFICKHVVSHVSFQSYYSLKKKIFFIQSNQHVTYIQDQDNS